MRAFATSIVIDAAPEHVWRVLTDAAAYPDWNSTVTGVDGRIAPGETVTVHAKIAPGRAFPVKVAVFDVPSRMVWRSAMPLGLFRGVRTFVLSAVAHERTEFSMDERYSGLMAPLIVKSIPDLQPAFDEFAACLKAQAEKP